MGGLGLRVAIRQVTDVLPEHEIAKVAEAVEQFYQEHDPGSSILRDADEVVNGPRTKEYGPPDWNFQQIATAWSVYLARRIGPEYPDEEYTLIKPYDVCMMMVLLKAMRVSEGYHRDSVMDIAGYVAIADQVKP